jgi:hypothetical protein
LFNLKKFGVKFEFRANYADQEWRGRVMEDPKGPKAPKKEDSQLSAVFTINLDAETDDIPGVTRLISAKSMKPTFPEDSSLPPTNAASLTATSLHEFSVVFEIRFCQSQGKYRFTEVITHQAVKLEPWQTSLLEKMTLDLESLSANDKFQEYESIKENFIFDVFGVNPKYFMQVVQLHIPSHQIYVLVTEKSVAARKTQLLELLKASDSESSVSMERESA